MGYYINEGEGWKDEEESGPSCACCEEELGEELACGDPDLGLVCHDCYWRLRGVRNDLYTISQQPI